MVKRVAGTRRRPRASGNPEENIVDKTIVLGEEIGWSRVRLRLVAERLDIPLSELQSQYSDLDAIADAWFAGLAGSSNGATRGIRYVAD